MALKLVPNAKEVATKASSMWAVYGVFLIDVGIKVLEYIRDNRDMKWQDMLIPIALMVVGAARLIQQRALATATERRLVREKLTSELLEEAATSEGPPISQADVAAIKQTAAAAAGAVPTQSILHE